MTRRVPQGFRGALAELFARIQDSVARAGPGRPPLRTVIAGGAAVFLHVGARSTEDVDATFSKRLLLDDITVGYRDAEGRARALYLDRNYHDTLGLMHPDALDEARPADIAGIDRRVLDVRVLAPLDLAVSKLTRYGDADREDIERLARAGLVDAKSLRQRAEEALGGYVGNFEPVRTSIELACRLVESAVPKGKKRAKR